MYLYTVQVIYMHLHIYCLLLSPLLCCIQVLFVLCIIISPLSCIQVCTEMHWIHFYAQLHSIKSIIARLIDCSPILFLGLAFHLRVQQIGNPGNLLSVVNLLLVGWPILGSCMYIHLSFLHFIIVYVITGHCERKYVSSEKHCVWLLGGGNCFISQIVSLWWLILHMQESLVNDMHVCICGPCFFYQWSISDWYAFYFVVFFSLCPKLLKMLLSVQVQKIHKT